MYDIDSIPGLIELGHLNENGVCEIEFDVTEWLADYPLGVLNITYIRPGETDVYPVEVTGASIAAPTSGSLVLTLADGVYTLTWTVSDAVTAIAGSGSIVVELAEGGTIKKRSDKVQSYTADGHAAAGDPPEPLADYIEKWSDVDITVTGVAHDVAADGDITQDADGTHITLDIPAGHPGVHIGTDEPTDPLDTVWIDTDAAYDIDPDHWSAIDVDVTTLEAGADATGSITQDATGTHFDLGIPQGIQGIKGDTGAKIVSGEYVGTSLKFTLDDTSHFTIPGAKSVPDTWLEFQAAVRDGTIDQYFAVGDQFNVTKGATNLVFDIVDIGSSTRNVTANGNAPTDANYFVNFPNAKPVTLLMHDCIYGVMFDNAEANYNITTQINSGATCVISLGYGATPTSDFRFTASKNLVVGGKIRYIDATHFGYYSTATATVESMSMAAGAEGDGFVSIAASLSAQNNLLRVQYGSNKYTESAIKQYLCAAGAATTFWTAQTVYDLAPSWHSTLAGFQNGLDADLLAVIGQTTREVELNTITDGGGNTTITDKIFLPSEKEIYGSAENVTHKGVEFQEYVPLADIDKIKYDAAAPSTAYNWWLRSPNAGTSYSARNVYNNTGALNNNSVNLGNGAAAACVIL